MLINLTDVLSCEEKVVKRTVETELKSFTADLGSFPLSEEKPLELTLTNLGEHTTAGSGALETAQGALQRLAFLHANFRHLVPSLGPEDRSLAITE